MIKQMRDVKNVSEVLPAIIIIRAIQDWMKLVENEAEDSQFEEIRRFFKSEWAEEIWSNPIRLLNILEKKKRLKEKVKFSSDLTEYIKMISPES